MPKRLAITVAGAVSLGSYEAGVLYEVLEALRQHNEYCDQHHQPDDKILIDVLTGASAGGMTAVIAVQKLLYEQAALTDPKKNSFYQPWVEDVSLDKLFALRPKEDPSSSLFSSDLIGEIADRHILSRYQHGVPERKRHPAAAEKIHLGLALSNLNGVTFSRPLVRGQKTFEYSRFQDEWRDSFDADNPGDDTRARWEPVRNAALSCGAFPVAFRLVPLRRSDADFKSAGDYFVPFGSADFAYTDGGVFQNEPLGLARDFVGELDGPDDAADRFYLFVAPGALKGQANSDFKANSTILKSISRLATVIFQQARFHDWITAETVNERIRRFDEKAEALKHDILLPSDDPSGRHIDWRSLKPAADALLPVLYRHDAAAIATERNRLSISFAQEMTDIETGLGADGPAAASVWLDSMLAFERAAELDDKDEMKIYGITASNDELASDLIYSFGGFFQKDFREHDYFVGRQKARDFLESQAQGKAGAGELGPIHYPNPIEIPTHPNLGKIQLKDLPEQPRKELRERLLARISESLKALGVPGLVLPLLRGLVLRKLISKPLGL
jgi:hypothetical protein